MKTNPLFPDFTLVPHSLPKKHWEIRHVDGASLGHRPTKAAALEIHETEVE